MRRRRRLRSTVPCLPAHSPPHCCRPSLALAAGPDEIRAFFKPEAELTEVSVCKRSGEIGRFSTLMHARAGGLTHAHAHTRTTSSQHPRKAGEGGNAGCPDQARARIGFTAQATCPTPPAGIGCTPTSPLAAFLHHQRDALRAGAGKLRFACFGQNQSNQPHALPRSSCCRHRGTRKSCVHPGHVGRVWGPSGEQACKHARMHARMQAGTPACRPSGPHPQHTPPPRQRWPSMALVHPPHRVACTWIGRGRVRSSRCQSRLIQ